MTTEKSANAESLKTMKTNAQRRLSELAGPDALARLIGDNYAGLELSIASPSPASKPKVGAVRFGSLTRLPSMAGEQQSTGEVPALSRYERSSEQGGSSAMMSSSFPAFHGDVFPKTAAPGLDQIMKQMA